MKTSVKTMGKTNSAGFEHLKSKFPNLSAAKIKEGVFVGPQIKQVFRDPYFVNTLSKLKQNAWNSLRPMKKNLIKW